MQRTMGRLILAAGGSVALAVACVGSPASGHRPLAMVVLGADNVATLLDTEANTIARVALAAPPPSDARLQPGRHIARSTDGSVAYFLVPTVAGTGEVVALELNSGRVAWRAALPGGTGEPRAIITAFAGRVLLALTDRPVAPGLQGYRPRSQAMAFGLDLRGHPAGSWVLRSPSLTASADPEDWTVLDAVEDTSASVVYVSFHNQGAVPYSTAGRNLTATCLPATCLPAHGQIALWSGRLLLATGSRYIDLISGTSDVGRQFDTQLDRNHLMSFAVDARSSTLYAAGSCLYEPGLSRIDLGTGALTVLAREGSLDAPCGETITVVGRLLALAGPDLALVDARTGRAVHHLRLPAVDVAAI